MAAKNTRTKTLLSLAEKHPKQRYSRAITLAEDAGSLRSREATWRGTGPSFFAPTWRGQRADDKSVASAPPASPTLPILDIRPTGG
jgi:hypothetical protein